MPLNPLHHWENRRGRAERNRSSSVSLSSGASCQTVRTSYMQHRRNSTTLTTRIPRRKPWRALGSAPGVVASMASARTPRTCSAVARPARMA